MLPSGDSNYKKRPRKKKNISTHLVTGDLLILSGSSVTLKNKTKACVRNPKANQACSHLFTLPSFNTTTHTTPPSTIPKEKQFVNLHQWPHQLQYGNYGHAKPQMDLQSLQWMYVKQRHVRGQHRYTRQMKQMLMSSRSKWTWNLF